jgi:hypothetical protein
MDLDTLIDFIKEVCDPFVCLALFIGISSFFIVRLNGGSLLFITPDGREILKLSKILIKNYGFNLKKIPFQGSHDPSILLEGTFNGKHVFIEFWNGFIHENLRSALNQDVKQILAGMSVVVYLKDGTSKKVLKKNKISLNEILFLLESTT